MKKAGGFQVGFFCVAVILSLCVVGIGAAAWRDDLKCIGSISTGEVDVVFTYADLAYNNAEIPADCDDKTISINVARAKAGDEIVLRYKVTNRGSVPARVWVESESSDSELELKNSFTGDRLLKKGDVAEGTVNIIIGEIQSPTTDSPDDAEASITCDFSVKLGFQQWNIDR